MFQELIGTLRSTTPTSTKTSFAIIASRSRRTLWTNSPKNKLLLVVSD